jgi:uncharacterized membrane protein
MRRGIQWGLLAIAVGLCLFGVFKVGDSFRILMAEHKPTGSSLTLALGVVSLLGGVAVFVLNWVLNWLLNRRSKAKP